MKKIILSLALSFVATSSQARVCPDYTPTCSATGMIVPKMNGKIIPDHGNGPMVALVSKLQEEGQTVPPIFPDPKIASQVQEWPYDLPAIDKLIITDTAVDIDELKRQLDRSEIQTGCNVEIDEMPTCKGAVCKTEKVSWLNCN